MLSKLKKIPGHHPVVQNHTELYHLELHKMQSFSRVHIAGLSDNSKYESLNNLHFSKAMQID